MSYETGREAVFLSVALGGFFWILGNATYRSVRYRWLRRQKRFDFREEWDVFVDMVLSLMFAAAWLLAIVWIYTPEGT